MMSALGLVAIVIGIFFIMGIWVGVIGVVALAALREDSGNARRRRRGDEVGERDKADVIGWREPPGPGTEELEDDTTDDDRPQWPGTGHRTLIRRSAHERFRKNTP